MGWWPWRRKQLPKPIRSFGLLPVEDFPSPWVIRMYYGIHRRNIVRLAIVHLRRLPKQRQQPFVAHPNNTHEIWLQTRLAAAGEKGVFITVYRAQLDVLAGKRITADKTIAENQELIQQADDCAVLICDYLALIVVKHGVMANLYDADQFWTNAVAQAMKRCQ